MTQEQLNYFGYGLMVGMPVHDPPARYHPSVFGPDQELWRVACFMGPTIAYDWPYLTEEGRWV